MKNFLVIKILNFKEFAGAANNLLPVVNFILSFNRVQNCKL